MPSLSQVRSPLLYAEGDTYGRFLERRFASEVIEGRRVQRARDRAVSTVINERVSAFLQLKAIDQIARPLSPTPLFGSRLDNTLIAYIHAADSHRLPSLSIPPRRAALPLDESAARARSAPHLMPGPLARHVRRTQPASSGPRLWAMADPGLAAQRDQRLRVKARAEAMAVAHSALVRRNKQQQAMTLTHPPPADKEREAVLAAAAEEEEAQQAVASLRRSLAGSLTAVKDHFSTWDADGDGLVSKAEFKNAIAALALESTADACDAAFDAYDVDRSGAIDYHEYVRHTLREALVHTASRVLDLFRRWDEDRVGTVDAESFRRGLVAMGFDAPRADLDALYAEMAKVGGSALLDHATLSKTLRQGAI